MNHAEKKEVSGLRIILAAMKAEGVGVRSIDRDANGNVTILAGEPIDFERIALARRDH